MKSDMTATVEWRFEVQYEGGMGFNRETLSAIVSRKRIKKGDTYRYGCGMNIFRVDSTFVSG